MWRTFDDKRLDLDALEMKLLESNETKVVDAREKAKSSRQKYAVMK